jgi:hypothetical protein
LVDVQAQLFAVVAEMLQQRTDKTAVEIGVPAVEFCV